MLPCASSSIPMYCSSSLLNEDQAAQRHTLTYSRSFSVRLLNIHCADHSRHHGKQPIIDSLSENRHTGWSLIYCRAASQRCRWNNKYNNYKWKKKRQKSNTFSKWPFGRWQKKRHQLNHLYIISTDCIYTAVIPVWPERAESQTTLNLVSHKYKPAMILSMHSLP